MQQDWTADEKYKKEKSKLNEQNIHTCIELENQSKNVCNENAEQEKSEKKI